MPELTDRLAAMFGRPAPAAAAPPAPPAPPTTDFFSAARAAPLSPTLPGPTVTLDVRQAATEALTRAGYFETVPAPDNDLAPDVSIPVAAGLFRNIAKVGPKPKGPRPPKPPRTIKAGAPNLAVIFGQEKEPEFAKTSKIGAAQRRQGVKDSFELKRILHIARRPAVLQAYQAAKRLLTEAAERGALVIGAAGTGDPAIDEAIAVINSIDMTSEFRRSDGQMDLWDVQTCALAEGRRNGGAFLPAGVGAGKTLISLLMAAAIPCKQAVLLVPPGLRAQLLGVDIPRYARHWKLPLDRVRIISYTALSSARGNGADEVGILDEIAPTLIIADEVHNLRHRSAARTKRFLRYMHAHPDTLFVGMSGTITRKSIKDYQHLIELALKKNTPLPKDFGTLCEWAEALDVADEPMPPGALLQLCDDRELEAVQGVVGVGALHDNGLGPDATPEQAIEVQSIVRGAFRRRLVESPGVVATDEGSVDASLNITALRPLIPGEVRKAISDVLLKWDINGEQLVDALAVARIARQLAAGFYYRWAWPLDGDGKPKIDDEWLNARRWWNKEVREILKRSRKGLDSPMLIASACERGEYESEYYEAWRNVKSRPKPATETIWISDFLIKDAIALARERASKSEPMIIWYSWDCVGKAIAEAGGFPLFAGGKAASEALTKVDAQETPIIVCSLQSHGTGKNLQMFTQNLITTPPSGGIEWEQGLGRTHRPGQLADEVNAYVYVHTAETEGAFRAAVMQAQYIEATTGQRQKLCYAEKIGFHGRSGTGADAFVFGRNEQPEIDGIEWTGTAQSIEELFNRR
jgi:hypothetical protein